MKIILILLSALIGVKELISQTSFVDEIDPSLGLLGIGLMFLFSIFAVPLLLSFYRNNAWLYKVWLKPRWSSNPFNFRNPIDFISLGGYSTLVYGVTEVIGNEIKFQRLYVTGLSYVIFGIGMLLGVFLSHKYFLKAKFEKTAEPDPKP